MLPQLPIELFRLIFSSPSLRGRDLYDLRLVSTMFLNIVTPIAFRSMCCPVLEHKISSLMEFLENTPDARKYLRCVILDGTDGGDVWTLGTRMSLGRLWILLGSETSVSSANLILKEATVEAVDSTFQRRILSALAEVRQPATLKSLYVEHFIPDGGILTGDITTNLIGPLTALSIFADCDTSLPHLMTLIFWSYSHQLFSPRAILNLRSLAIHSTSLLGYTPDAGYCTLHFPNLQFLSLMGHLVGPNSADEKEDPVLETFILSHKKTLVALELINCPILIRTEEYLESLYQMADAFDAFRAGLGALKTFTIVQDGRAVSDMRAPWDIRLDMYAKAKDEDGNVWNPRFCYVGLLNAERWYLEDFKDADYEPDWQRDRDALTALMATVKSRTP